MSRLDNASTPIGINNAKRKKKFAVQKESKRTKVAGASTDSTVTHNNEADGYSACDLLKRWSSFGTQPLYNEFMMLRNERIGGTFSASLSRENASRNRYTDILCLDRSRVILGPEPGNSRSSDYINANFVDGYKQKKAYIATQGPLHNTCEEFWQTIWEQNVCVIVMTTRTVEKGHHKCAQYWPKQSGKTQSWKIFSVVNKSHNVIEQFIETELLLRNNTTGEERCLTHLFFTSWPDHGVPSSAKELLSFMFHVRQKQKDKIEKWNSSPNSSSVSFSCNHPIVIHCSAGIGRTGTFITMDICIRSLEDTGRLNILSVVQKLRSQRAFSIQTVDQYIFCHKALVEYCEMNGLCNDQSAKISVKMKNTTTLEASPFEPE